MWCNGQQVKLIPLFLEPITNLGMTEENDEEKRKEKSNGVYNGRGGVGVGGGEG